MKRTLPVILITAVLVTSCSFFRLALRYSEWVLVREVSRVFELNDLQRAKIKSFTHEELNWLKKVWLPDFIRDARELTDRWQDGLSVADHQWFDADLIGLRIKLGDHGIAGFAQIATSFSDKQLDHATIELAERNERWSDLLQLDDKELAVKRRDRLEESTESWYGNLSKEQSKALCPIFGCGRIDVEKILASMQSFQQEFLSKLRTIREPNRLTAVLLEFNRTPVVFLPIEKRSDWLEFRRNQAVRLAQLDALMTTKQRDHAIKKAREMIQDLEWFSRKVEE